MRLLPCWPQDVCILIEQDKEYERCQSIPSEIRHAFYFYGMSWRISWIHIWLRQWPSVTNRWLGESFSDKAPTNSPISEEWKVWMAGNSNQEVGIGCTFQPAPSLTALQVMAYKVMFQKWSQTTIRNLIAIWNWCPTSWIWQRRMLRCGKNVHILASQIAW